MNAILNGDLIGLTRRPRPDRRRWKEALGSASRHLRELEPIAVPHDVALFRGDSFQLLVSDPTRAVRAALWLRAFLRAETDDADADARIAIGIGDVEAIPDGDVSRGDGPAYWHSGRLLESMRRRERMRLAFPEHPEEPTLDAVVRLIDGFVVRWTALQARAVVGAMRGWPQERIATEGWNAPVTQQAIAQHLSRAAWDPIEHALEVFETRVQSAEAPR